MWQSKTARMSTVRHRTKPISKPQKQPADTPNKHPKSKLQKKRSQIRGTSDIQHAFRIHGRDTLGEMECMTSLRLLGWAGDGPDALRWFEGVWGRNGEGGVGEAGFRSMVGEAKNSPFWQSYTEVPEMLKNRKEEVGFELERIPAILRVLNAFT